MVAKTINTQVITQNVGPAPSFWELYKWWIIGGIGFMLLMVLIAWGIYKLIMGIKYRKDATAEKRKNWVHIAKRQARKLYYRSFFKPEKNAPVCYWYSDKDGKKIEVKKFGYYYGDALLDDGFRLIMFSNRSLHWLLWFIPKIDVIIIPMKSSIKYLDKYDTKEKKREFKELENIPTDMASFTEEGVYILCYGFSEEDGIFKPVLKNAAGEVIDYNIAVFQAIEGAIIKDVQYETLNAYVDNSKRSMAMNSDINKTVKIKDSTGNAE